MSADPLALLWPRPQRLRRLAGSWAADAELGVRGALRIDRNAGVRASGYRLRAGSDGIQIQASDPAGERHARRTLEQIVRLHRARPAIAGFETPGFEIPALESPALEIPALEIEDWPDFPRRGVLLDISRSKVPTMGTLFALVEWLASLKIDELQLYTEHTFAYAGHEEVWRDASPVTPQEVRALDAFCRERGVDLVPNQQSLGHMHRWLSRDRYRSLAEVPEGVDHAFSRAREPFSLCPTDPASLRLLAELYGQLLPNFGSRFLAVGLDESFDIGMGRSRGACQARGKGRVYLDFLRQVHALARERGRRIQFWGDVVLQHPELLSELPRDAIALAWGYEQDHPFAAQVAAFAESGLAFYVCPGTSSWQSLAGRTRNAAGNLAAAAVAGREAGAAGYLVADWGDRGHLQPIFASYSGFLLGAGFAWNASAALDPAIDLQALLDAHAFADRAGVLGRAAVDLGNAYLETGCPSTNGSALFFLLAFAEEPLPHARMPGLSLDGLERARAFLTERRRILGRARSDRDDAELAAAEMGWAADLLLFACRFGEARLRAPPGAPVGALPRPERRALADELAPLVLEHRRCFLQRNRPGGLEEAAGWLERILGQLN